MYPAGQQVKNCYPLRVDPTGYVNKYSIEMESKFEKENFSSSLQKEYIRTEKEIRQLEMVHKHFLLFLAGSLMVKNNLY
jgi:hypothetical protein